MKRHCGVAATVQVSLPVSSESRSPEPGSTVSARAEMPGRLLYPRAAEAVEVVPARRAGRLDPVVALRTE